MTSLRTFGSVDIISDNLIWSAGQDVSLTLYQGGEPFQSVALLFSGSYQDSRETDIADYFAPNSAATVTYGALWSLWHTFAPENTIGLSFRAAGGSTGQQVYTIDAQEHLLFNLEATVTYLRHGATYGLVANFYQTFALPDVEPSYWSAYIGIRSEGGASRLLQY